MLRIGFFTDSFYPNTNGITVIVDSMQKSLMQLGHEVYVFAPKPINKKDSSVHDSRYIKRVSAINGMIYHEQSTSIFFPARQYSRVKKLDLDVIVVFTPAQIGMLGSYCALKQKIPLVSYYSTDLVEYIEQYPNAIFGVLALISTTPIALRMKPKEILKLSKLAMPSIKRDEKWRKKVVREMVNDYHNRCQYVIVPSVKSHNQMKSWGLKTAVSVLPAGVDPPNDLEELNGDDFRRKYKIPPRVPVIMYLGRVAKEKNIELAINAMKDILPKNPEVFLVIVGDFDYRRELEKKVKQLKLEASVIFTGKVSFEERWQAFRAANIFVFPSVTDTQAIVINEAGLCELPIVWCDEQVNELLVDGVSGQLSTNHPKSFAITVNKLLNDKIYAQYLAQNAKNNALQMSQINQAKKLIKILEKLTK